MTGGGPDLARWGIAAPLEPLPHGHRNRVLRTRGLDPDLVFKSTRRGEAALAWLAPVHDAAEAVGWRVPRLVPSLRGQLAEAGWTAEPYVAGAPLPPERWPEIRGGVAGFHRRTALLQQRPGFRSAVALIAAPRGGDVDLRAMPPRLAAACRSAWRPLRGVPRTVVHGDLTPDNLHIDRRGRLVVMDWDEARRDAVIFDRPGETLRLDLRRARLAWEIACCWRIEPARAARLARALQANEALTPRQIRPLR